MPTPLSPQSAGPRAAALAIRDLVRPASPGTDRADEFAAALERATARRERPEPRAAQPRAAERREVDPRADRPRAPEPRTRAARTADEVEDRGTDQPAETPDAGSVPVAAASATPVAAAVASTDPAAPTAAQQDQAVAPPGEAPATTQQAGQAGDLVTPQPTLPTLPTLSPLTEDGVTGASQGTAPVVEGTPAQAAAAGSNAATVAAEAAPAVPTTADLTVGADPSDASRAAEGGASVPSGTTVADPQHAGQPGTGDRHHHDHGRHLGQAAQAARTDAGQPLLVGRDLGAAGGNRLGRAAGPSTAEPTPATSAVTGIAATPATQATQATAPTGAAGTATTAAATPVDVPEQVFASLGRLVRRGDGMHRLTIKLQPEALGEVRVVLTVRDGDVSVRLSGSDAAQRALLQGANDLQRLLESVGARSAQVVVGDPTAQNGNQAGTGWTQQNAGSNGGETRASRAPSYAGAEHTAPDPTPTRARTSRSVLDVTV